MTEFLNYKVDLFLKDGTKSTGVISYIDKTNVTLLNVYHSINPNVSVPSMNVPSTRIADVKVVQLPVNLQKKNGKPVTNNRYSESELLSKSQSTRSRNTSRAGTPKLRLAKLTHHHKADDPDWDCESDVNDIKTGSEFDFAANLAMFDKKTVFADFQRKDNVSLHDRLVGHNKVENVKKINYDNKEMVLEKNVEDNWDKIGEASLNSSNNGNYVPRRDAPSTPGGILSPQFGPNANKSSVSGASGILSSASFSFISNESKESVQLASPVQLLEVERLSVESFGIDTTIMAEVCAVNLSQLILNRILGGSTRLSNKKNHNLPPLVLLLVGSGRCAIRAFATGRHLANHGIRVLAFAIRDDEDDVEFSRQKHLFMEAGGKLLVSKVVEMLDIINLQLESPVELILDALQGYDTHLDDIFYQDDDMATLTKLFEWCNEPQQAAKIMSLDVPSGLDGGSGTIIDPSLTTLKCKWCVSMGIPISGLIHAYKNGHLEKGEVTHYLLDVGVPNKVYSSKPNLRKFDKCWYSATGCVKLDVAIN
ncbi:enhancer of mRNA decapping [Scheffersomyces spartinae]|uniref:Enhancer of mRNA-decapping protein 3 n=1 Tax=Scheffersomyces spartinae TaxID=45513 RepID=A0A9P8AHM9_9ASCO|nr:enhancer of mRNA decapping [Scheffersomyces spartinae]KAG7192941.1 enhancer of mRNA decapping [Scheffersomyces spartinae]